VRLSTSIQSLAVFIKKKYIGQEIKLLTYFNLLIMYKVVEKEKKVKKVTYRKGDNALDILNHEYETNNSEIFTEGR